MLPGSGLLRRSVRYSNRRPTSADFSALLRTSIQRQAALDPARAGGAASHAFLDVMHLGETDALRRECARY
jgi:hypothetical protein